MTKLSQTAKTLVDSNKQSTIEASKILLGKQVNKQLVKLIKPKMPMMTRGYIDTPLFKILLANIVSYTVKNTKYQDNKKLVIVADALMSSAMLEQLESFNIEGMLEDFMSSIKLPGSLSFSENHSEE